MAYIGNPVQQGLTKVTSQSFNGTGSQTVFTLNRAVNTGEELEVFVENVQQEPGVGKSYTATGTTLTFDAAPQSGTGNIYVIYRGIAEVTRRLEHDPNQALAATTGTFSGDLTVDTNTLYVDSTNNRVGVGTISPDEALHIAKGANSSIRLGQAGSDYAYRLRANVSSSVNGGFLIEDAVSGTDLYRALSGSSGYHVFITDGSERLRILPTGGITFNGDTAAANALDDYEEGTFDINLSDSNGGSNTINMAYVKIGRMVAVEGPFRGTEGNASGSYFVLSSTPDSNITLSCSLPFTPASSGAAIASSHRNLEITDGTSIGNGILPALAWNAGNASCVLTNTKTESSYHRAADGNTLRKADNRTNVTLEFNFVYFTSS